MTERDNRAQDLLRTLLAEGWSQAEIARRIGRDPRLVRFVLKGLKPGTNLVEALTQLARGEDVTPPPRRRDRKGRAAKVRSKRGRPSHRPSDIGGEPPVLGEIAHHNLTPNRRKSNGSRPRRGSGATAQPRQRVSPSASNGRCASATCCVTRSQTCPTTVLPTHSNSLATTRMREDKPPICSPRSCQKAEASGCTRNYGSKSMKVAVGSAKWCGWGIRAATTAVSLWKTCGCSGMRCRG